MATKTATQTTEQSKAETPNRKPIHEIRLSKIKAAIWQNDTDNGVRYNVTLGRLYKEGQNWKQTESFGRDDLPALAEVIHQTWLWIFQKQQEE
jgi:aryl-phospho-beta-D-glucosidase BglC (GH1 family)